MFLVVAKKTKTFSRVSCSANEQMCRSWEGKQPHSSPKLANELFPYHRQHAQFIKSGWQGGRDLFSFPGVWILSCLGVWTSPGVCSFSWVLQNSQYLWALDSVITAWGLSANRSFGSEKIVLHIVCFAYSLLLVVVLFVISVFPLLSF